MLIMEKFATKNYHSLKSNITTDYYVSFFAGFGVAFGAVLALLANEVEQLGGLVRDYDECRHHNQAVEEFSFVTDRVDVTVSYRRHCYDCEVDRVDVPRAQRAVAKVIIGFDL